MLVRPMEEPGRDVTGKMIPLTSFIKSCAPCNPRASACGTFGYAWPSLIFLISPPISDQSSNDEPTGPFPARGRTTRRRWRRTLVRSPGVFRNPSLWVVRRLSEASSSFLSCGGSPDSPNRDAVCPVCDSWRAAEVIASHTGPGSSQSVPSRVAVRLAPCSITVFGPFRTSPVPETRPQPRLGANLRFGESASVAQGSLGLEVTDQDFGHCQFHKLSDCGPLHRRQTLSRSADALLW